jgi:DNA helicase-2/ATP-dependent DNA helicase PcrA
MTDSALDGPDGPLAFRSQYTRPQAQAIASTGQPLQIIACAGSGKTQVISARIARLLGKGKAKPGEIVAFTFTDKAAAELRNRILSEIALLGDAPVGLAEMFVGTMHAFALDLLQTYVPASFKYSVLNEVQARLLVDRNSRKSGLASCPTTAPRVPLLRRYQDSRLYLQVMSVLREDQPNTALIPDGVRQSFASYRGLLHRHAYFDYTEILQVAVELLENEVDPRLDLLRDRVRRGISFVVVDEYQDVNPVQERMIEELTRHGANLCVVGDDDQTIYQWRGSDVSNILEFAPRHPGTLPVRLTENFRSSPGIVELGRSIAERIPREQRLPKSMTAAGHQIFEHGDLLALEFTTPDEEARWISDRIEAMRGLPFTDKPGAERRGLSWSDFAVLYRSVAKDADALAGELRRRAIPFVVKGLNRLFDSPEIQAVVRIFAYMAGETDSATLRDHWHSVDLIPAGADFDEALAVLDHGRAFEAGSRWGAYNIQRLYLDFLAALRLREETVPGGPARGELIFYQFGKFSQAISDYEQVHFASDPAEKYRGFARWLEFQAPDYYADGDQDSGYARPDAVVLSTVHQAKGAQWPAVFIPCLRRNRFPSQRHGGLGLFHVVPPEAIPQPDRYRGTVEDETRLFYVAVTRAQRWLACSYSPGSRPYGGRSEFFDHVTRNSGVLTRDPGVAGLDSERLSPQAKSESQQVTLSFSELKYLFECPYQFKLRFLYGFNAPLHEALGFGKGLHDALAEVHKRALAGELLSPEAAAGLIKRHLHTPFAYPSLRTALEHAAIKAVERYLLDNAATLPNTLYSEKQIQVNVSPDVTVAGRIDLIRRVDTGKTSIVDFKSSERAQAEDVTRDQLHVYALGYQELTGNSADLIEVLNLDPGQKSTREFIDKRLLDDVRKRISRAGTSLRDNDLPKLASWSHSCERCDLTALCRTPPQPSTYMGQRRRDQEQHQ